MVGLFKVAVVILTEGNPHLIEVSIIKHAVYSLGI